MKRFLADGGMILFDTREADFIGPATGGPAAQRLREILRPLDLPSLGRITPAHVLTKAFYLLQDFPGRVTGAPVLGPSRFGPDNRYFSCGGRFSPRIPQIPTTFSV